MGIPVISVNLPALTPEAQAREDKRARERSMNTRRAAVIAALDDEQREQLRRIPIDQIHTWMDNHRFAMAMGIGMGSRNCLKAKLFRLELIRREWSQ